ncbi:MAG TPA: vanadium-dependent haloperoxidase [Terriglobales bacterium]|nr:vanadium-dependent haloperoxidase [Terriglobales bacterium]
MNHKTFGDLVWRTILGIGLTAVIMLGAVARADTVLDWNVIALKTTFAAPLNPPLESRNLAIVHAAMFDAVNSIVGEFHSYAVEFSAPKGASPDAAAAAAAHFALVQLYPAQQTATDAAYSASLAAIPDGSAKSAGIAVGEAVAAQILALRSNDGADTAINAPYTPGSKAGDWLPTPPTFALALDPGWGSVHPFVLKDGAQFRPGPPPTLTSLQYTADFNEIKEIGSATSSTRTQAQTDLARFWMVTGPQNWNPAARQVALARGLTLSQNARLFALLALAGADAFLAAWDAKYTYNQWRPITAIRAADTDGNPDTAPDPGWNSLLPTPRFPDYIAGHTTYAGAAKEVLEHILGKNPGVVMTLTSASAPGVTESYTTFEDIADGVVNARVWGGIHWRTSSVRGQQVGEKVGRYAVLHLFRPKRQEHDNEDDRSCDER